MDAVLDDAQEYPYFVQLWGRALWREASKESRLELETGDVEKCQPAVGKERAKLYENRFEKWETNEDKKFLVEIADKVADGQCFPKEVLIELGKDYLEKRGLDPERSKGHIEKMIKEGVIWKRGENADFGQGIPSFVKFATERAARIESGLKQAREGR